MKVVPFLHVLPYLPKQQVLLLQSGTHPNTHCAWTILLNLSIVCVCVCVSRSNTYDSLRPHGLGSSVHGILQAVRWVLLYFADEEMEA